MPWNCGEYHRSTVELRRVPQEYRGVAESATGVQWSCRECRGDLGNAIGVPWSCMEFGRNSAELWGVPQKCHGDAGSAA